MAPSDVKYQCFALWLNDYDVQDVIVDDHIDDSILL